MRDESIRRDRSKDLKVLEDCLSRVDERALEQTRDQVFQETSKRNFDAWLAAKPVPYWGTEREKKS